MKIIVVKDLKIMLILSACPYKKSLHGNMYQHRCDSCGETGCDDQAYCKAFECIEEKNGLKCDKDCNCTENSNSKK